MISFEEAQTLHKALQYDSVFGPRARLTTSITRLAPVLDQAMGMLEKTEIIVFPWEYAGQFQQQWGRVPEIQSVRDSRSGFDTQSSLWGYFITYRGVDCLASGLTPVIVVSGVRDLRKAYEPEDRVVLVYLVA